MGAVGSAVPPATSSTAPLYTTAKSAKAPYPAPAVTGPEATGQKPEPPVTTGKTVQWQKSPATGLKSPPRPVSDLGDPPATSAGQQLPWIQPPYPRGRVTPVAAKGRLSTLGSAASQWSRTTRYGLNDIQSQDVDAAGWINPHANDRAEFTILRGATAEDNVYYWPGQAANNPVLTPLAVTGKRTGSSWTPAGVSSAYTEPAPYQATAESPGGTYVDPAEEWL
jgi:hypothetical protein